MRIFALALLLLALGMALAAPAAHAASGTVTYLQRNYTVRIQTNGDVQIVEHWQVQFSGGPFHTAHLDLHMLHTSGIVFGAVSGATAGSQHTMQATDASGNPMTELDWDYPPAQDTTRSFDIPYTIHGALQVGTDQAWLDWTFLDPGANQSSLAVDSTTVTETLPADAPANSLSVQATNPETTPTTSTPDAHTATASVRNVVTSDGLEVEVAFPRTLLAASVQRPAWQTSDTPPTLPPSGSAGGPYGGGAGSSGGASGPASVFPGVSNLCGCGFIPLIIFGLIIFSVIRSFFGVGPRGGYLGRRWYGSWGGWGGPWGPWYGGGPWNHPGGPWGGGGFGGGGFGGGGMGGGGGFGGGAGGGGGGGGSGFG